MYNLSSNDHEVDVLFQEADGVWLCMQGKYRPKIGDISYENNYNKR